MVEGDAGATKSYLAENTLSALRNDDLAVVSSSGRENIFRPRPSVKTKKRETGRQRLQASPVATSTTHPDDEVFPPGRKTSDELLEGGKVDEESAQAKEENTSTTKGHILSEKNFILVQNIICLAIFSVLGESLREFVGNLLGGECDSFSTSWLYSFSMRLNFCVSSKTGALFVDIFPNMLGCFIMGMLQPCQDLDLISSFPIAFLGAKHWFQSWKVAHLGLRTGFCGALTTFASWNTQMIEMISGTTSPDGVELISATSGYVIGLELSLCSLILGQDVAVWLHRLNNSHLSEAEPVFAQKPSSGSLKEAQRQNRNLPDFERRYLGELLVDEEVLWTRENVLLLKDLRQWKESTENHRRTSDAETRHLRILIDEIENCILVEGRKPNDFLLSVADEMGWEVDSMRTWAKTRLFKAEEFDAICPKHTWADSVEQVLCILIPAIMCCGILVGFGIVGFSANDISGSYKTMFLSALFSPLGTILRWQLSVLNGKPNKGSGKWFPMGTLLANLIASVVSACAAGLLLRFVTEQGWGRFLLSAVQTGFAGSLSTVSTYVVEGNKLQKTLNRRANGYWYMIGSLVAACLLGLAVYAPLVRA